MARSTIVGDHLQDVFRASTIGRAELPDVLRHGIAERFREASWAAQPISVHPQAAHSGLSGLISSRDDLGTHLDAEDLGLSRLTEGLSESSLGNLEQKFSSGPDSSTFTRRNSACSARMFNANAAQGTGVGFSERIPADCEPVKQFGSSELVKSNLGQDDSFGLSDVSLNHEQATSFGASEVAPLNVGHRTSSSSLDVVGPKTEDGTRSAFSEASPSKPSQGIQAKRKRETFSREEAPPSKYTRSFCHGFVGHAVDDLTLAPLQRNLVDPVLRPGPHSIVRSAYDCSLRIARTVIADQVAQSVLAGSHLCGAVDQAVQSFLQPINAAGSLSATAGLLLGGFAYAGLKYLMTDKSEAMWAKEVAVPANIIYDSSCSLCLKDLVPGAIVVLVHPPSGHANLCRNCFDQVTIRDYLRVNGCPLCRRQVTGRIFA